MAKQEQVRYVCEVAGCVFRTDDYWTWQAHSHEEKTEKKK